jgi:hypothetical protein
LAPPDAYRARAYVPEALIDHKLFLPPDEGATELEPATFGVTGRAGRFLN